MSGDARGAGPAGRPDGLAGHPMTTVEPRPLPPLLRSSCPTCAAAPGEPCLTDSGRPVPGGHSRRWDRYFREMRDRLSRWRLLKDDDRFGLVAGDVLVGQPYWLDPDKVTVNYREADGFDPRCNQYRVDVQWVGWAS